LQRPWRGVRWGIIQHGKDEASEINSLLTSPFAIQTCYKGELVQENRSLTLKTIRKMDSTYLILDELINMLPVIFCGGVLPIMVVWFVVRKKINETNARTQIITTALEKNPDLDIEELLKKISTKKKLLKEKLLTKLLWGFITSLMGIGLIVYGFFLTTQEIHMADDVQTSIAFGVILLSVGAAFIINYGVGRKMLAKEIEAEENKMNTQA
jgi:hypothetical protein